MSSPIVKKRKNLFDKLLIAAHQASSHRHRVSVLAECFASKISQLIERGGIASSPRVLDVGCGDRSLGVALEQRLPGLNCTFVDIHPVPVRDGRVLKGWENYVQFDGKNLPFEKLQFDVGIFSDVLHHVPDEIRDVLLMNALKKCRFVIIKDHFEYGFFTRTILRGMDFVGNFGYGVSVPSEYFNEERFAAFCERAHAQVVDVDVGVELYRHLPVLRSLLSPKLHFIAVCQLRNVVD